MKKHVVLKTLAVMIVVHTQVYAAFDCLIEPTQMVEISSPVVGLLDKVLVQRGDRVNKGQVVAMLESRAEQAATELARAKSEAVGPTKVAQSKIEFSKRKFDRRKGMADEHLMAPQERDESEADYELAKAELQSARENKQIAHWEYQQQSQQLNLRTLRSPFKGVVVDQMLYPGEVVEPSGAKKGILKLAQLDPLKVHAVLPIAMFGKVTQGMQVEVIPEAPVNGHYTAKVSIIDKLIDAASGTFVVFLDMPNPKLTIPSGLKCKVDFPLALSHASAH